MSKQTKDLRVVNNLLHSLTTHIDESILLLKKENKLLEEGDVTNFLKTLSKKQQSLIKMQDIASKIRKDKNIIENNAHAKKIFDKTKTQYHDILGPLMKKNEILLLSNIKVNEKIIEIYNRSRVKQIINQCGYNKDGKISVAQDLERNMPSINVNNKI